MSAAPKIFEGTWEEISLHARELAGRHLKVIVVDDQPASVTPAPRKRTSEEWVTWLTNWAYNRAPIGPLDDSRDAIYEDYLK